MYTLKENALRAAELRMSQQRAVVSTYFYDTFGVLPDSLALQEGGVREVGDRNYIILAQGFRFKVSVRHEMMHLSVYAPNGSTWSCPDIQTLGELILDGLVVEGLPKSDEIHAPVIKPSEMPEKS